MAIEAGLDWADCPPDVLMWIQLRSCSGGVADGGELVGRELQTFR
jgi:hypothetical protein